MTEFATKWEILKSWPVSVHIHDIDGISHPLTPMPIRQMYETEAKNLEVVVWADTVKHLVGIKAGISEHAWKVKDIKKVSLLFARPAKGAGFIWLSVEKTDKTKEAIASANSFSDKTLDWFRSISASMTTLSSATISIEEEDIGYDA